MLFNIVEKLPTESPAVVACCNPIPPLVRLHANDIATLIGDALEESKTAPLESVQFIAQPPREPSHMRFDDSSDEATDNEGEDMEIDSTIPGHVKRKLPEVFVANIAVVNKASKSKLFGGNLAKPIVSETAIFPLHFSFHFSRMKLFKRERKSRK
jgi:hypothetical protein